MRNSELEKITENMLTPEFVTRLHYARCRMGEALRTGQPYDATDLAEDLEMHPVIANLLLHFIGAIKAEGHMTEIVTRFHA